MEQCRKPLKSLLRQYPGAMKGIVRLTNADLPPQRSRANLVFASYTTATAVTSINCSGRPNIWCMDTPVADGNRPPKYLRRTSPTFR